MLKLPLGSDGFFLEAHPKLKPLETVLDGIYLAGACQGPKDLAESITQASGAAAKILALFARDTITLDGLVCGSGPGQSAPGAAPATKNAPFRPWSCWGKGK